jgi:diacylglycerol kinase family enzyme
MQVYWGDEDVDGAETGPESAEARWLFAFNLPCYGGGLSLAPQADGSDGLLDVCVFHRGSWWHGLRYVTAVLLGRHHRLADCTTRRVRRLRITADAQVPYQLDGDPGGYLPVDVEVLPDRLTMVVPRSAAAVE